MKRKLIALSTIIFAFFFLTSAIIGQAKEFIKGFSLKFTGGYGTMATGDYNTVGKDYEQLLDDYKAYIEAYGVPASRTGEFKKVNMGFEFEGELLKDLGRNFGIGFAVGYIRRSNSSEIGLSVIGAGSMSIFMEPKITVIPINLSLYFFPRIARSMNIYLCGGFGYYIGKTTGTFKITTDGSWYNSEFEIKDKNLGFRAGAGLEFNIASKVAIFIEGKGRYCKLKSWEGDNTITDSTGLTDSESGTLWYYEAQDSSTGKWYSTWELQKDKPSGYYIRNIREFAIDLAGISLRAGIRIKF